MGLGAEGGKAVEHFGNACGIDIGKGNAQFARACRITRRAEHGARQHQERGLGDKAFAKLIRTYAERMFDIGSIASLS